MRAVSSLVDAALACSASWVRSIFVDCFSFIGLTLLFVSNADEARVGLKFYPTTERNQKIYQAFKIMWILSLQEVRVRA